MVIIELVLCVFKMMVKMGSVLESASFCWSDWRNRVGEFVY